MDCSHVGNSGYSGIQLGQVEGVKNTTGPVRKKKNFDKKITARTEARILGPTEWATMTTRDSVE